METSFRPKLAGSELAVLVLLTSWTPDTTFLVPTKR